MVAWQSKSTEVKMNLSYYNKHSFWGNRQLTWIHQGYQIRVDSERQSHESGFYVMGKGESLKLSGSES